MENNELEKALSSLTRKELLNTAFQSIQIMDKLIYRTVYICKFLKMPDEVIQEVLMMSHDQAMFDVTMRTYYETLASDNDPFMIVDLTTTSTGGGKKNDKSTNTSKNDSWNRSG